MEKKEFIAKLDAALSDECRAIFDEELKTDFAILRRQRQGESVPPKQYWSLKSFPLSFQASYVQWLCQEPSAERYKIQRMVFERALQTAKLVLEEWAERPSMEVPTEQVAAWLAAAKEFDRKTGYYQKQLKQLCKKPAVRRAFRNCFLETTGRRMRATEDCSIFRDEQVVQMGDARIIVEWDCGGWDHFREEVWVEWLGERVMVPQSLCSWLGYFPIGAEGWFWILQDDLDAAAHDAVQQTIQFRDILAKCVRKALE